MAALFNAYLLEKRGKLNLTEAQKRRLGEYFDTQFQGNVCDTFIDHDNGDKSMAKRNDSDRRVLLIDRPELLVVENLLNTALLTRVVHRAFVTPLKNTFGVLPLGVKAVLTNVDISKFSYTTPKPEHCNLQLK